MWQICRIDQPYRIVEKPQRFIGRCAVPFADGAQGMGLSDEQIERSSERLRCVFIQQWSKAIRNRV
jgi:hypothetical protein